MRRHWMPWICMWRWPTLDSVNQPLPTFSDRVASSFFAQKSSSCCLSWTRSEPAIPSSASPIRKALRPDFNALKPFLFNALYRFIVWTMFERSLKDESNFSQLQLPSWDTDSDFLLHYDASFCILNRMARTKALATSVCVCVSLLNTISSCPLNSLDLYVFLTDYMSVFSIILLQSKSRSCNSLQSRWLSLLWLSLSACHLRSLAILGLEIARLWPPVSASLNHLFSQGKPVFSRQKRQNQALFDVFRHGVAMHSAFDASRNTSAPSFRLCGTRAVYCFDHLKVLKVQTSANYSTYLSVLALT